MQFTPWDNPMGTDGFEFVEYAAPDPQAMGALFERMGFMPIARHRHKNVLLYRQGEINFIVNAEPDSFAQRVARLHGPSICAIAFRVQDAKAVYERAVNDMIERTSTDIAPWNVIASDDKRFSRIEVLKALCQRIEERV